MTTQPPSAISQSTLVSLGLWTAVLTFALDQIHKWWMILIYKIESKGRVHVAPFWDWAFTINKGISYGLFAQSNMTGQYMLAAFSVVVSAGLAIWLARGVDNKVLAASVGLLMGGALGNALDRVLVGGVIDYISLHANGYYWYIFNIADVAIVAGVAGLLYDSWVSSRADAAKSAQSGDRRL